MGSLTMPSRLLLLGVLFSLALSRVGAEDDIDEKAGPISVTPDVSCGRFTSQTVIVEAETHASVNTHKESRRCVVLFRLGDTCNQMQMTCDKCLVDNHDPYKCKKGDALVTKCQGGKPHRQPT